MSYYGLSIRVGILMLALAGSSVMSKEFNDVSIKNRFEIMNPENCKRLLKKKEPRDHAEAAYFGERYHLDVDGDGICEIIDVWVDVLPPLADDLIVLRNEYRTTVDQAFYRISDDEWKSDIPYFEYKPKYQIRDKLNNRIYFLFDFHLMIQYSLIKADGVKYFDRWPTDKEENRNQYGNRLNYGVHRCNSNSHMGKSKVQWTCDGIDFDQVLHIILNGKN